MCSWRNTLRYFIFHSHPTEIILEPRAQRFGVRPTPSALWGRPERGGTHIHGLPPTNDKKQRIDITVPDSLFSNSLEAYPAPFYVFCSPNQPLSNRAFFRTGWLHDRMIQFTYLNVKIILSINHPVIHRSGTAANLDKTMKDRTIFVKAGA